jgi:uncharacterized protein YcbX
MLLGKIAWIRRYPVKSLHGEHLESAEVTVSGLAGDRMEQLVVDSGHVRVGRAYRGKENDRLHLAEDVSEAIALASERGVALHREHGGRFFDDAPISLIVDRWIDEISEDLGFDVEPERFRPNFYVRASADFCSSESELVGAQLEVGGVRLRVREPTSRCVAVTYHPRRNLPDPRVLRSIAQKRDSIMGVYCEVLRAGVARTGDSVRLAER